MKQHGHPNTKGAAKYLNDRGLTYTENTLAVYRGKGRGPKFLRIGGRIYYRISDLDAWLAAISHECQSTADYRGHEAA